MKIVHDFHSLNLNATHSNFLHPYYMASDIKPHTLVLVSLLFLFVALAVVAGYLSSKYLHEPTCNCIKKPEAGWRYASSNVLLITAVVFTLLFLNPDIFVTGEIKSQRVTLLALSTLFIASLVGWYIYGTTTGDATCDCYSQTDVFWNFSGGVIALFLCFLITTLLVKPSILFKSEGVKLSLW
jgi:hypothetical protein